MVNEEDHADLSYKAKFSGQAIHKPRGQLWDWLIGVSSRQQLLLFGDGSGDSSYQKLYNKIIGRINPFPLQGTFIRTTLLVIIMLVQYWPL